MYGTGDGKENKTDDAISDDDSDAESGDEAGEALKSQVKENICTDEAVKVSNDFESNLVVIIFNKNFSIDKS